jgi:hypothetical protein
MIGYPNISQYSQLTILRKWSDLATFGVPDVSNLGLAGGAFTHLRPGRSGPKSCADPTVAEVGGVQWSGLAVVLWLSHQAKNLQYKSLYQSIYRSFFLILFLSLLSFLSFFSLF